MTPYLTDPDVIARGFYWPGADRDDVRQEAAYAAILAARSHDPARGSLRSFVRLVVTRHLTEQVRRERYRRPQFSELPETVSAQGSVVDLVHARERLRTVLAADLTPMERTALGRAARGEPCTEKRLDNALQRARRKLSLLAQAPERVEAS